MQTERAPEYIHATEKLLGTRAFYDDGREQALHSGSVTFTAESAGIRGLLYVKALRLLARAKKEQETQTGRFRMSSLEDFTIENITEVGDVARQLAVINTAERTLAQQEEGFLGGLRPHQHPYLHDVIDFLDTAPFCVRAQTGEDEWIETYIRGATVEAPTGVGKTVLIARTLAALGVGRPIEGIEYDREPVRALIIVPSQTLVEQMTGKIGDDTLRRFAPGMTVGGYYQHEKDLEADVVVITIDQFVTDFRDGTLQGERFDICIIDEAHHATEPQLQRALLEHWRDGPIIGFTATPEYLPGKDVRNLLPHRIFHGDILDFIESEDDILNAAQLFMIRATYDAYLSLDLIQEVEGMTEKEVDQLIIREVMAEWLEPQVAEGRRGIIFCEQGGREPSGYAKLMAERLSQMVRPDGTPLRVAVAGSINAGKSLSDPGSNQGIRRRYRDGELDFIVTVDWGREGLNEDIDTVGIAGKVVSKLKFMQQIGRGTRLSKHYPVTTYGHIFVPTQDYKAQSLLGVFGFENVEDGQGMIVGKKEKSGDTVPAKPDTPDTLGVPISAFPSRIQDLIASIQTKTVTEALFDTAVITAVPRGYQPLREIMKDVPGPAVTIRRYLRDNLSYACVIRAKYIDGKRTSAIYFEPAAKEYLDTYRGCVARVDLQRQFGGVDVSIVERLAAECNVTSITWFYYDGKRIPHYTKDDTVKIVAAFNKTEPAKPTDYSYRRLSAESGIDTHTLRSRLTRAEKKRSVRRRTVTARGLIRVLDHWEQADALQIIERLKTLQENKGIPTYLVPRELAIRHVNTYRDKLTKFAIGMGHPPEMVRIAESGRPPYCVTWAVLQEAEAEFGLRHSLFTIDYSQLPTTNAEARDEAKKEYALKILAKMAELPKTSK